jgi:hypothetical protein
MDLVFVFVLSLQNISSPGLDGDDVPRFYILKALQGLEDSH